MPKGKYNRFSKKKSENAVLSQTIYDEQDNSTVWPGLCQNGKKQSPIDLKEKQALYLDMNQLALQYQQYDQPIGEVQLENDGKSVVVSFLNQNFQPTVTYIGHKYFLRQFHFHWGASEHALNGHLYDGEIHLVHTDSSNNVLVLGALLVKSNSSDNLISQIFRQSVQTVQNYGQTSTLTTDKNLKGLLKGVDLYKYLTYEGSLTTPDCEEGVRWIVYPKIIEVDGNAIEDLKQIKDKAGNNLLYNNRRLQPLNNRTVYKTYMQFLL